ncbi:MAG: ferrous iron transport protein B [Clostridia bacterium]|nr:ferrous iron transport protein B [Clostridia bacterium]
MNLIKIPHLKVRTTKSKTSPKPSNKKIEKTIAIAGNPNVGKSTVFNALTGLNQHTGNWPGKTVACACGKYTYQNINFNVIDIPGTYSLLSNSSEEEIARDFICFGKPDAVIVVLDATCIERNLNLALQILELTPKVIICLNLIDEAYRKKIHIDVDELSLQLGVPIVTTNARSKKGLNELMEYTKKVCLNEAKVYQIHTDYGENLESAISKIKSSLDKSKKLDIDHRWLSIKLLENNKKIISSTEKFLNNNFSKNSKIQKTVNKERKKLKNKNIQDTIVESIIKRAEKIYQLCVKIKTKKYNHFDRTVDNILTSKITGIPIMVLLLLGIFWITITGANYPSEIIASGLFWLQDRLLEFFISINSPEWLYSIIVLGIYRTLAWVVSVMLPPMAIFFPLFTILEDIGYLPRVAFNLDNIFKKSGAHGKQALTMCMGFGCNACGAIGCRIVDSPREQLIALITNNFVPCNGRFPLLISIITMFFITEKLGIFQSFFKSLILTLIIVLGILVTFIISKILSKTILKGVTSSFILELPPYRKPQIGKILVRSVLDRTIFVLGRAIAIAAPAGLIIWLTANIKINDISIFSYCSDFLNPFAKLIGLDGVILMAFILGFPANEIVFPIIIMSYMCTGSILEIENHMALRELLISHGWTYRTAICTMLFSLMHFPCGTTCWTIKNETKSVKWTALAFLIPTITGIIVCFIANSVMKII